MLNELHAIQTATDTGALDNVEGDATLAVVGNLKSGEVKATYTRDEGESKVEIVVTYPPAYPLVLPTVDFTRKISIEENRWRRWILQVICVTEF